MFGRILKKLTSFKDDVKNINEKKAKLERSSDAKLQGLT